MNRNVRPLVEGGHFYEAPRWHDGTWWVVDFYAHTVLTVTVDGSVEPVMEVEGQPSGMGWMPDGSLLVVSMKDQKILRRSRDGSVTQHADLSDLCGGAANDMVVDRDGGAYVGNFGFDIMAGADPEPATLIRVDPDGAVSVAATDMYFPNGSVILPDEQTLIVGETIGCRYSAFTIGPNGELTDRRVWAQLADTPALGTFEQVLDAVEVAPDGCALDAEGLLWTADAVGGRVIRVAQGGQVTDQIPMPPGLGAFACALGGRSGQTLLICSAPDFDEHARTLANEAMLFTVDVGVARAGRP